MSEQKIKKYEKFLEELIQHVCSYIHPGLTPSLHIDHIAKDIVLIMCNDIGFQFIMEELRQVHLHTNSDMFPYASVTQCIRMYEGYSITNYKTIVIRKEDCDHVEDIAKNICIAFLLGSNCIQGITGISDLQHSKLTRSGTYSSEGSKFLKKLIAGLSKHVKTQVDATLMSGAYTVLTLPQEYKVILNFYEAYKDVDRSIDEHANLVMNTVRYRSYISDIDDTKILMMETIYPDQYVGYEKYVIDILNRYATQTSDLTLLTIMKSKSYKTLERSRKLNIY